MTSDELLQNIKDGGALPPAQTTLTDAKILTACDAAMALVASWLHKANGSYFTDSKDYTLAASTAAYTIPERSMGLESVRVIDSSGNDIGKLEQYEQEELDIFSMAGDPPVGFYFTASQVVVLPTPTASPSGSIRIYYRRRPGSLVADTVVASQHTQVGIVSSLNATTITLTANHNGWPANTMIDLTDNNSPFRLIAKDVTTTTAAAGSATIAVGTDLTGSVSAGDYVTLARKSYVPQIPQEWHEVLEVVGISKCRRYLRDFAGSIQAMQEAQQLHDGVLGLYRPRVSGSPKRWSAWL